MFEPFITVPEEDLGVRFPLSMDDGNAITLRFKDEEAARNVYEQLGKLLELCEKKRTEE